MVDHRIRCFSEIRGLPGRRVRADSVVGSIGERCGLRIVRVRPVGLILEAGSMGEVLLPRNEVSADDAVGGMVEVFLHTDSEDRPVATRRMPRAMPGGFARMSCVAVNAVGAFVDWGLTKDLLVPFREQASRMQTGKSYLVHVLVDAATQRIIGSTRIARHLDRTPHAFRVGDAVELIVFRKSELGWQAVVDGRHSGLLHADRVMRPFQIGERLSGHIVAVRPDGKLDLGAGPPGRGRVVEFEDQLLAELRARGGFWAIGDHTPAAEIREDLGVSKRTFKQALGALLKRRAVMIDERGVRLVD